MLLELNRLAAGSERHGPALAVVLATAVLSILIYGRNLRRNIAIGMQDAIISLHIRLNPGAFRGSIQAAFSDSLAAYPDALGAFVCRILRISPYTYDWMRFSFYHVGASLALYALAWSFGHAALGGIFAVLLLLASDLNEQGASFGACGTHGPYHSFTAVAGALGGLALLANSFFFIPGAIIGLVTGYHPIHGGYVAAVALLYTLLLGAGQGVSWWSVGSLSGGLALGLLPWGLYLAFVRPWRNAPSVATASDDLWWHIVNVRGYSSLSTTLSLIGSRWYSWLGSPFFHALAFSLLTAAPYAALFVPHMPLPGHRPGQDAVALTVAAALGAAGLTLVNYVLADLLRKPWAVGFAFARTAVFPVYLGIAAGGASLGLLVGSGSVLQVLIALGAFTLVTLYRGRVTNNSAAAWLFALLVASGLLGGGAFAVLLLGYAVVLVVWELRERLGSGAFHPNPPYWDLTGLSETLYAPEPIREAPEPPPAERTLLDRVASLLRLGTLARSHRVVLLLSAIPVAALLLGLTPKVAPWDSPVAAVGLGLGVLTLFWSRAAAARDDGLVGRLYARQMADDWHDAQQWIRLHTPVGSMILAEPYLPGFQTFSERPNLIDFIDISACYYTPSLAPEIERRLAATGFDIAEFRQLNKGLMRRQMRLAIANLRAADLDRITAEFGVAYFVFHRGARAWPEVPASKRLYENGHFCVMSASPTSAATRQPEPPAGAA
jgi:hypothetical protein